ncbi:hypothetical protein [Hymenobacter arizonensis]|uniref:Uncharacterized protein n=1 Tax=Hymenobacter arizonensis TaxID=1227077 RepID=A0A1I6BNJ0_HYMAR|nr:hypothetical protein [Hymenobacter arizonensis]SFQ82485.1 hypothetical protein SAMN04515668_4823 [Hymenobacter arizonensis]
MPPFPRLVTFYRYVLPVALVLQFVGYPSFVDWVAAASGQNNQGRGVSILIAWCILLGVLCFRTARWAQKNHPGLAERYWILLGLMVVATAINIFGLLLWNSESIKV